MKEKIINEIEERRNLVDNMDREMRYKNNDYFRSFWMNVIIISSATIIGVLPLIGNESLLIKSILLAKIGLFFIFIVIISGVVYYENTLRREKELLFDQSKIHEEIFSDQIDIIKSSDNKTEQEIQKTFEGTKIEAFIREQKVVKKHLVGGKFPKIRIFINKYFSRILCSGFIIGLILIILSFLM